MAERDPATLNAVEEVQIQEFAAAKIKAKRKKLFGALAAGVALVGGGYSANDNRIAAFPVASGEQVVVNRNRDQGSAARVVNIDNRIIVNGAVDADVMSQMKVSRYQQTQRMRAGLARA